MAPSINWVEETNTRSFKKSPCKIHNWLFVNIFEEQLFSVLLRRCKDYWNFNLHSLMEHRKKDLVGCLYIYIALKYWVCWTTIKRVLNTLRRANSLSYISKNHHANYITRIFMLRTHRMYKNISRKIWFFRVFSTELLFEAL